MLGASVIAQAAEGQQPLSPGQRKAEDLKLRAALEEHIAEVTADPEHYQRAMNEGRERVGLCKYCHGEDGNAIKEGAPSIAGQNPAYIVDQFQRYGDGHRYDPWMANLAKTFSQDDKIKLAIYFSQQKMKPMGRGDPNLLERGKQVYSEYCTEGHGTDARGKEGYARLAGQRPEYILKMLREFKTPGGSRSKPWMFARANMLKSEEDMRAVATYLANLE